MMANGGTAGGMVLVEPRLRMATITKENIVSIKDMDADVMNGTMVAFMMACFAKTSDTAGVSLHGPMGPFTKENSAMDNEKDTGRIDLVMVVDMKVRGVMDGIMVLVFAIGKMVAVTRVNGSMAWLTAGALKHLPMDLYDTMDNGLKMNQS